MADSPLLSVVNPQAAAPASPIADPLAELEQRYRQHLIDQFGRLTFKGAQPTATAVSLPLGALYVELKAIAEVPVAADTFSPEERQSIEKLREVGDSDPFVRPIDALHSERWRHQARDDDSRASGEHRSIGEARDERRAASGEHPPVTALASFTRSALVLLGEPGSGKSTLLHYLALMAAGRSVASPGQLGLAASILGTNPDDCRLPIFVPLAAYDDHLRREQLEAGLHDFLALYYERRRGLPGLAPLFQAALLRGRALVLLDGLDEVIDRSTRDFVTQQVATLIRQHSQHSQHGGHGNRFLVTSRVAGYREVPLPSDIPHATVLDFGPAEIAQFAQKWCRAYEIFVHGGTSEPARLAAAAEEHALLEDLRTTPSVAALATNPLLLTMLALLRRQVGRLPQRRVELYDRYLDALLRSRVELRSPGARPEPPSRYDAHQATLVLIELSLWLHQNSPSGTARRVELVQALAQIHLLIEGLLPRDATPKERQLAVEDAERFLHDLRHLTGILAERGRDAFGFLHLTFQEFFVGRALARRTPAERWQIVGPRLHDPRWREPLLLCAGWLGVQERRTSEVDALARQILGAASEHEELLHRDLFLAAALLIDDVGVSRRFQDELANRLAQCCDDRVPSNRRKAVAAVVHLARRNHEPSRHRIEAWLHPDQKPRRVIEALRSWGAVRLFVEDPLIIAASLGKLDDGDSEIRAAAAHALGSMAAGAAVQQTLLSKLDDPKARVRGCAAAALTVVATTPAVQEALVRRLEDSDSGVRAAVVRALVAVATVGAVPAALLRRVDDAMPAVRAAAVHALTLLAAAPPVQLALLRKLEDAAWRVREAAVESLCLVATAVPVQAALMQRLGDPEPLVRAAAVKALRAAAADPSVQAALMNALADKYPWVRTAAVDVMAIEAPAPAIQQALLRKLTDENSQVRVAAARGLFASAGQAAVQTALFRIFDDPEPGVRLAAASALLSHRDPSLRRRAVEVVRASLRAQVRWVRQQAIAVVSQIELGDSASDAIRDLLHMIQQDPDEAVRDSACHAVHRLLTATNERPRAAPRPPAG